MRIHSYYSQFSNRELIGMQDSVAPENQLDYLREITERLRQLEYQEQVSEFEERLRGEHHGRR